MHRSKGSSIIELVIVTMFLSALAITISLSYVNNIQGNINVRLRETASSLAMTKMQEIKQKRYALIPLTTAYFTAPADSSCDCSQQDFSNFPVHATRWYFPAHEPVGDEKAYNKVIFQRQVCINYVRRGVSSDWESSCPGEGDTGYKNIRIRVGWSVASKKYGIEMSSLATR